MENLKKYITGIICCLCAILLMSHNASATIADEVTYYGGGQGYFQLTPNNTGMTCISNCVWAMNSNSDITVGINYLGVGVPNGTYQNDTIFRYDFVFWKVSNSASLHMIWNNLTLRSPYNQWWSIYDVDFQQLDTNTAKVSIYLHVNNNNFVVNNNNNFVEFYSGLDGSFIFALNPQDRMSGGYWTQWATSSTAVDTQGIINAINAQPNYQQTLNTINNNINSINSGLSDVEDAINNQHQEETEATQDAADDAADAAEDNSTNQQTSNLIGVLQNFLSAITNFSGTDCNITLAFPNYAGGNMRVNVCQNKDKAGNIIGVFTSLTLIVFYLPLALKLLSMIYNEIRSFTNG